MEHLEAPVPSVTTSTPEQERNANHYVIAMLKKA